MRVPHRIDPVTVRKGDIITPNISIHVVTSQYLLHFPAAGHLHGGHTLVDSFVARRWQFLERPRGPICVGVPLIMIGAAGLLWCIWQFFSEGRGTLAPIDAPKQLVVRGLYRYVRNPMYVSVATILIGEAIWFMSAAITIEVGVFMVLVYLFVVAYEEPTLRRQFGESYEKYSQQVGRWIPRSRGN